MSALSRRAGRIYPLQIILLAAVYFAAAWLGFQFAQVNPGVTLVWPPAGIALAALVLSGGILWPGVFVGALLANLYSTGEPVPALLIAGGNTLAALLGAILLRRFQFQRGFERVQDVLWFFAVAVISAVFVAAVIGPTSLLLTGEAKPDELVMLWATWALGDLMGIILTAPLILVVSRAEGRRWSLGRRVELVMVALGLLVVAILVHLVLPSFSGNHPQVYLTLPLLIWLALRFSQREVAIANLAITAVTLLGGIERGAFLNTASGLEDVVFLWSFIGTASLVSMLINANLIERRHIEDALRQSQARIQTIVENLPLHFWATDASGRYILQNRGSMQRWGNVLGKTVADIAATDPEAAKWEDNNRRMLVGETLRQEVSYTVEGETRHYYAISTAIHDDGQLVGLLGVDIDITDRKRAEEAALENEARFRTIFERASIGITLIDDDGFAVAANPASAQMLGYTPEELRHISYNEYTHPDDLNKATPLYNRFVAGEVDRYQFDKRYVRKDGETIWVRISVSHFPGIVDGRACTISMVEDITDRKRAEQAALENEARFRSVFERANLGIVLVDRDGLMVSVNPAFVALVGYSPDELRQLRFRDITHPEDVPNNMVLFNQLLTTDVDRYNYEKRYIRKDGQIVWVRLNVSHFPGDALDGVVILALVENITERKLAEAALHQFAADLEDRVAERTAELAAANNRLTELDRLKTKFVADVSHELRTPLTILNTRVYLLERSPPERIPEYLAGLKEQIERLTSFVTAILDLSRIDLGKDRARTFEPIDLNSVVEEVYNALHPRAEVVGLTMNFYPHTALPSIQGDYNQLAQVVTNLLSNAIKYTTSGKVEVTTNYDSRLQQVLLEVRDTGMGISPDEIPLLFERFYRGTRAGQSSIPGTGLGLSIVKEVIDLHGGRLEVESEIGQGSRFRVWLPLVPAVEPGKEPSTP